MDDCCNDVVAVDDVSPVDGGIRKPGVSAAPRVGLDKYACPQCRDTVFYGRGKSAALLCKHRTP